jgi:hypothetical protein
MDFPFTDPDPCSIDIFLLYLSYDCLSSSAFTSPTDHERKVPVEAEPMLGDTKGVAPSFTG